MKKQKFIFRRIIVFIILNISLSYSQEIIGAKVAGKGMTSVCDENSPYGGLYNSSLVSLGSTIKVFLEKSNLFSYLDKYSLGFSFPYKRQGYSVVFVQDKISDNGIKYCNNLYFFSISHKIMENLSVGVSLKYIEIILETAIEDPLFNNGKYYTSCYASDFGIVWYTYIFGNKFTAGVGLHNLVSSDIGRKVKEKLGKKNVVGCRYQISERGSVAVEVEQVNSQDRIYINWGIEDYAFYDVIGLRGGMYRGNITFGLSLRYKAEFTYAVIFNEKLGISYLIGINYEF